MGCGVLVWGISEPPHCVGSYPTRHVREQSRLATIPVIALCTANSVAAIRTATARDVVGCGLSGTPHHQGAVCCPHPTPRGTPDPRGRVCVCVWGRGGVGRLPTRNAPVGARGYATPRDGSPSNHSSMGADQPRALRTTKPRARDPTTTTLMGRALRHVQPRGRAFRTVRHTSRAFRNATSRWAAPRAAEPRGRTLRHAKSTTIILLLMFVLLLCVLSLLMLLWWLLLWASDAGEPLSLDN